MSLPGNINQLLIGAAASGGGGGYEIQRSLRFNSADNGYLDRTPSSASNRKTFTFSCWVKASNPGLERIIFQSANSWFRFNTNDAIYYYWSATDAIYTDAVLRDPSAWYHLILAVDTTDATASNRIKIYKNGVQQTVDGTQPSQDANLDFNNNVIHYIGRQGSNLANMFNGYLAEVHFVDGQQLAASDFGEYDSNNVWQPKAYSGSYGTNGFYLKFDDNSNNAALGTDSSGNGNTWNVNNITAVAIDYVQSTTGTLYSGSWDQAFNGSTSTPAPYVYNTTASVSWDINISGVFEIYTSLPGTYAGNPTVYTLSNGATYSKSTTPAEWINLGSQTNVTSLSVNAPDPGAYIFAIRVDGTILVSTEPADTDSLIDSPSSYTADSGNNGGNYCTFNPLAVTPSYQASSLTNGNLDAYVTGNSRNAYSTIAFPSSGKYFFEVTLDGSFSGSPIVGVSTFTGESNAYPSYQTTPSVVYNWDGTKTVDGTTSSYGATYGAGDVIGVAVDMDSSTVTFYKNGSSQGSISLNVEGAMPHVGTAGATGTYSLNAGQRPFAYTIPTDHLSLCATNLPDSTIVDGGTAMNVALYTGNGASNSITGLGFSPDILWLKSRSNATFPALANSVVGPYYFLRTNGTNTESGPGYNDDIVSFDSDGFTLGADTYYAFCNTNNYTYVGWAWDSGTSTVTNTDGSISAQVRANQSTGCSVVTWTASTETAATIGHGLGKQPELIIAKSRTAGDNFYVFHPALDTGGLISQTLYLNTTDAKTNITAVWGSWTEMNSSTFGIYDTSGSYTNNGDMVAFCFTSVEGFSSIGTYEGNGSADGPFVYTGFRPAWVMYKRFDSTSDWYIDDYKRLGYNFANKNLYPNSGVVESTGSFTDFLSNGFKLRSSSSVRNGSGGDFIYAAFAEHPFKIARAR